MLVGTDPKPYTCNLNLGGSGALSVINRCLGMKERFVPLKRLETQPGGPMERTMLALLKDLSNTAAMDMQGRGVALGITSHQRACELQSLGFAIGVHCFAPCHLRVSGYRLLYT